MQKHKQPQRARIAVSCAGCGRPLMIEAERLKQGRIVCSDYCARSIPPPAPSYGPNWRQQQRATRARDGERCQCCGAAQQGRAFDVHHIRPFRSFGGDWRAANRLDNLVTLCASCHRLVESGARVVLPNQHDQQHTHD